MIDSLLGDLLNRLVHRLANAQGVRFRVEGNGVGLGLISGILLGSSWHSSVGGAVVDSSYSFTRLRVRRFTFTGDLTVRRQVRRPHETPNRDQPCYVIYRFAGGRRRVSSEMMLANAVAWRSRCDGLTRSNRPSPRATSRSVRRRNPQTRITTRRKHARAAEDLA